MKLLTITVVLSLMAFAPLSEAYELDWSKLTKCAKVGTKVAASFFRETIPELRLYLTCIDFTPTPNPTHGFLGYLKLAYELLKGSVDGNINCLVNPLKKGIAFLKPNIAEVDKLQCLN